MDALKQLFSPEIIWFVLGLGMLLLEFVMPGLIIAFFGFGAWFVAILCLIIPGMSLNMQLFIFIVASVALLLGLRKRLAKVFKGFEKQKNVTAEDVDDFIGHRVTVVKEIGKNKKGKVEFHGADWDAESDTDIDIAVGELVEIIGKNSITLKVKVLR